MPPSTPVAPAAGPAASARAPLAAHAACCRGRGIPVHGHPDCWPEALIVSSTLPAPLFWGCSVSDAFGRRSTCRP
eukprot:7634625-Alexandrium_andersonii.AAC.1